MNPLSVIIVAPLLLVAYVVSKLLYNIFLHPLRSYRGPLIARASVIEHQRQTIKGSTHLWLHYLHKTYGPVVRISPNVLSFIEPEVWKDVYGYKATAFQKDIRYFYGPDAYGTPTGILRADNANHARQRKLVSHAFSDKALKDQEQLLKGYAASLVSQLKKVATAEPDGQADLVDWYNFITFDIMADLTFGEDLGQLHSSKYNPWVGATFASVKFVAVTRIAREWGLTDMLGLLTTSELRAKRQNHIQFAAEKVDKRMARKTTRPDIWTYVMRNSDVEGGALAPSELHSNGAIFMLAGTETTATLLSGLTYMLLKSPEKLQRLSQEVREAFPTFEDLTISKLAQLSYLQACIEEGLRMYPPVTVGLPRVTPEGGANICGQWVPSGTIVQCPIYPAAHSPDNFKNPDIFTPERFLPEGAEEYASDRRDALNPFSFGPRNCLGKNLAYHEIRLVLASMLLHFDLELAESPETGNWLDQETYLLWCKTPLLVKLKVVT